MDSEIQVQRAADPRAVYEFQLSEAESIAALEFNQSRLMGKLRRSYLAIALRTLGVGASATLSFLSIFLLLSERSRTLQWLVAAIFASMGLTLASQLLIRRRLFRALAAMDGTLRDRRTITLEKEGLRSSSARGEAWIPWKSIQSIEEYDEQILLYFDDLSFVPVPGSAFADDAERDLFLAELPTSSAPTDPPRPIDPSRSP